MIIIENIKIVLVEPAGDRNLGSIARVMRNMGLNKLTIVNPACNHLSDDAQIMAVHGVEVLKNAQICQTIPEAIKECQKTIATTARERDIPTRLETPKDAIPWLLEDALPSAIIFGPEDRGLSNQELSYAQRFICIPANPEYPSLNLAQAVGVCCYELYQTYHQSLNMSPSQNEKSLATLGELEGYYQHLESLLLKISYLQPHTANNRMEKIRRIVNRANLSTQELALLRGMLRQTEWGLQNYDRD